MIANSFQSVFLMLDCRVPVLIIAPTHRDKELRVQSKIVVWECASSALAEFTEQTGGALNEGTRIKPEFSTTHSTVTLVFRLFHRSHEVTQVRVKYISLFFCCLIIVLLLFITRRLVLWCNYWKTMCYENCLTLPFTAKSIFRVTRGE